MADALLDDIRWLGESYVRVSNLWAVYQTTGDQHQLTAARTEICNALGRLSETSTYWAAVINAAAHVDENAPALRDLLADLDRFGDQSAEMFGAILDDPRGGVRLGADLVNAVAIVNGYPTGQAIMNLRRTVDAYRDRVCADEGRHGFRLPRGARLVVRGVNIVGGLFVIGVSIATMDATPPGLAGVLGGVSMVGGGLTQ